jgi:3-dehydroquinate synthase
MQPTRLEVAAASGAYPVIIAPRSLGQLTKLLDQNALGASRFVVSSPLVWQLHGDALRRVLKGAVPILVPDGERSKTLGSVSRIYDALTAASADRSAVVIAAGGGHRGHGRLRCGHLSPWRPSGARAHDPAGAGG